MNQNNRQIILLIVFVVVLALGVAGYFVVTSDTFDERMEAGFEEDPALTEEQEEFEDLAPDTDTDIDDEIPLDTGEVEGDITGDGEVTMADFQQFREDQKTYQEEGWSDELSRSDLTGDQQITMEDYQKCQEIFSEAQ